MSETIRTGDAGRSSFAVGCDTVASRVKRSERDPSRMSRVLSGAAAVGLVVAVVLAVFGMPPVDLHPPFHYVGIMDPFCGMTRGSAATMRGDLAEAWWFNPASPLVIVGGVLVVGRWVVGRATGAWVQLRVRLTRPFLALGGLLVVALEVNQQLHAARLR